MAHVILTVSQFAAARAFYGRLLPALGMTPVILTIVLLRWRSDSDRHPASRSGA